MGYPAVAPRKLLNNDKSLSFVNTCASVTLKGVVRENGITLANMSVLKTGEALAARFATLDAICATLQCQRATWSNSPRIATCVDRSAARAGLETETAS